MRRLVISEKNRITHIEAPGCIINIQPGLFDREGRQIVSIRIAADGARYAGNPQWWIEGKAGNTSAGCRVIQTDTPAARPVLVINPANVAAAWDAISQHHTSARLASSDTVSVKAWHLMASLREFCDFHELDADQLWSDVVEAEVETRGVIDVNAPPNEETA